MQKVESSSLFIRFPNPLETAGFVFSWSELELILSGSGNAMETLAEPHGSAA
jgi:hypothetical protein